MRIELVDRIKGTIKDGYTSMQIPDLTHVTWSIRQSKSVESSLRTWLDFLLGNSTLLRSSNRLFLKLPDLFVLPLPTKSQWTDNWCLVIAMNQGKFILAFFFFIALLFLYLF